MSNNSMESYLGDYANMRTLPGMLSIIFVLFGAFAFGAIGSIDFQWFDYSFQQQHAVLVSLGAYAAAFASSETRRFESYDQWEQVAIAAGPAVIIGWEYIDVVQSTLMNLGDPLGAQIAFALTIISWAVATQ